MADNNATVNIPKDVLEPIIQAHMTKALSEALGGPDRLLSSAVEKVLAMPVGNDGKPAPAYERNPQTFANYLIGDTFRAVAKEVFLECVEQYKPELRKEILKQLNGRGKSSFTTRIADAMVQGFENSLKDYRYDVTINLEKKKSDY